MRWAAMLAVLVAPWVRGITISSEVSFVPSANAPLAGTLTVNTDVDSLISISVNDGAGIWQRNFFDYGTNHTEIALGFKAGRTNLITVIARDKYGNVFTNSQPLTFVTAPLPANMPQFIVRTNNPAAMEPGYTLFRVANSTVGGGYVIMVDNAGQVVWYGESGGIGGTIGPIPTPSDVRQLTNGNLFFPLTSEEGFQEVNMLGQTISNWSAPKGYPVDSHEDLLTSHGTILYLSYAKQDVPNFPTTPTDPGAPKATAYVSYDRVVEISAANSKLVRSWNLLSMLDPARIDYLCFLLPFYGIDPEHANAIIDVTADDALIVSLRNQDAIVKFSRSGVLEWILGPPTGWGPQWQRYLLKPVGKPFEWNYAQHAPVLTPQGTLLFYDDGNCRADPYFPPIPDRSNYSRAAEFSINEKRMEVSQVWEFSGANDDRLYTGLLGNATMLPKTSNVLVTFGAVSYENGKPVSANSTNATMVRIKEVTHTANPTVVFDLELFDPDNTNKNYGGYNVYRSYRVSDLYAHPATAVANLTIQYLSGRPVLRFTADPFRTYVVQASADSLHWHDLAPALPADDNGDYSFVDGSNEGGSVQYYRVVTY